MKKTLVFLLLAFFSVKSYAQAGDLFIGAQGGYITHYNAPMYGLNVSYDISNPLQISFTGLMNPDITRKDALTATGKIKNSLYSANLDARFFFLNLESFSAGISLGAQYLHNKETIWMENNYNTLGVNIGCHVRANLTDNLRLTGGWRYSTLKDSESYNLFYVGIGYAFNVY